MKRLICCWMAACCVHFPFYTSAQPGIAEMNQVREDLNHSFFSAIDTCLVLACIFGITGALRIYHNWQMGRDRITSEVAAWFFAALFMVLLGPFLKALLGL